MPVEFPVLEHSTYLNTAYVGLMPQGLLDFRAQQESRYWQMADDYKIDAYGVNQYERIQEDQKTSISEIEGVGEEISSLLSSMNIEVVSDLLEADMDEILKTSQISENILDGVYEAVQNFVEREVF